MDSDPGHYQNVFNDLRSSIDPKSVKRVARIAAAVGILLFLFVFISAGIGPYTEYLWFLHDARHPEVFDRAYSTRGLLFGVSFVVGWVVLYANLRRALTLTMIFLDSPASKGQQLVTNAISAIQTRGAGLVRVVAPVLAFLSALAFGNEWSTYLLATHGQGFGVKDPTYGLDLSFFVFQLPWYSAISHFVCALLLLTSAATVAVYAGLQAMAALAKIELGRPKVRMHIHALVGVTVIAYGLQLLLKTYEVGLQDSGQFTGAGYAMVQGFAAQRVVAVLVCIVGLGTVLNGKLWAPYIVPARLGGATALIYILGTVIYPSVVKSLVEEPNRLEKDAPYAQNAIAMTRFGYGLDKIQVRTTSATPVPTSAEVADAQGTLDNMRLWDPGTLDICLEGLQGFRPYYRFYDVDVDRYQVAGKQTLLMLSPRQIDLTGLQGNARTWTNERLLYTHGYGIAVASVDQATPDGEPVLLDKDIPQASDPSLLVTEPRIYFGDEKDEDGDPKDEYAIVDTGQSEFDYPTSDSGTSTRWTGLGGIPVGGFGARVAFASVFGDTNLIFSPEIKSASRLLMHRNIHERVNRIYPFLRFDQDPYSVILNGRIVWVLDGYTITDMIPYSALNGEGENKLNYIRNSVKVTVDAYTGETHAYAVDEADPILKAWRSIYPTLIEPGSAAPAGLAAHYRYPEDMLSLQSAEMCTYHVADPRTFLGNGDAWNIASQRGSEGAKEFIRPFYVEIKLPDSPGAEFCQILPFTPNGRINMSAWLAARCDPAHYGQLILYRLDQSATVSGPEQMEGKFSETPEISNINKQFQNQQSKIIVGSLLVVPIGNSFMYAESLLLQSSTQDLQAVPRLTKVILAFENKVVVKDTYREALEALFGSTEVAPSAQPGAPPAASPPTPIGLAGVKTALDTFDQADAALRKGDFATYGALEKQGRAQLRGLLQPSGKKTAMPQ
jgi:uncharacterized protein